MKKAILIILGTIVVGLAGLIAVVALQPEALTISRSAVYNAPPEKIFAEINDFHNWEEWSPWAKVDPQMKTSYSGPGSGVGSSYRWTGNDQVGEGRMTITESHPHDSVKIDLEFLKPFESKNLVQFSLRPQGNQTAVNWTMSTKNGFIAKAFCLVVDMDKMLGSDFEKGLAQLRTLVEAQ